MQGESPKGFFEKRIKSFGHAFSGVALFFKETVHARVHALAAVLVLVLGLYFQVTTQEWALLFISMGLVLGLEAMNSALEYLVDLVSPDFHPLAKKAKDVGAGAVLLASVAAALVGALVLVPYLTR